MKASYGVGSKRSMILSELEDELERQLEEKASRNELSVLNVKSLLRAVLTHDDVRKYVEFTLNKTEEKPDYKLQLTRAKAKELIDKIPVIAPILCLPTPQKKSEIDVLISAELSEDSSDEEYQPADETLEDEEDCLHESAKDCDVCTTVSDVPLLPSEPTLLPSGENIGQRTRSKLSLSETPLETIEQAFIPPDITTDMYNTDCDNQDWLNFLKELVQPLDTSNDGVETNDDENDPEYNVMIDEELEALDNEEMRVDRAVKISKKELNNLMSELFDYMQMHGNGGGGGLNSDEENNTPEENNIDSLVTERVEDTTDRMVIEEEEQCVTPRAATLSIPPLEASPLHTPQPTPMNVSPVWPSTTPDSEKLPVSYEQSMLLRQQMMQHLQQLVQTYLLCCGNPFVDAESSKISQDRINHIKKLGDSSQNPDSIFSIPTMKCSLELMAKYNQFVRSNEGLLIRWNQSVSARKIYEKTRMVGGNCLPPYLMKMCLKSCAFQYPVLLPKNGFYKYKPVRRVKFSSCENALIVMGLHDCATELGVNIHNKEGLFSACGMIHTALLPSKGYSSMMKHIMTMKRAKNSNIIQEYFIVRRPLCLEHIVIPLHGELKPLYKQSPQLIPNNWLKSLYDMQQAQQQSLASHKRIKLEVSSNS